VPRSAVLARPATGAAIGHGAIPVAAVALLLGADRIMDSMRVSVNLLGNCVATFVVAAWEGQLDKDRMRKVLDGQDVPPLDDPDPMVDTAEGGGRTASTSN
jgi:aerobic C4-dicarboxylate transport protein